MYQHVDAPQCLRCFDLSAFKTPSRDAYSHQLLSPLGLGIRVADALSDTDGCVWRPLARLARCPKHERGQYFA
jgi:hypothetical protein